MSPQLQAALLRALFLLLAGALTGAAGALSSGGDFRAVLAAALVGAGTARALEGFYDGNRAVKGDVKPSDVGASKTP